MIVEKILNLQAVKKKSLHTLPMIKTYRLQESLKMVKELSQMALRSRLIRTILHLNRDETSRKISNNSEMKKKLRTDRLFKISVLK